MGQKMKNIFLFVLNKSQSVIHVILNKNFQGIFKNIILRSVALVTKKVMEYFIFFSQTGLSFHPVPTLIIYFYYSLKVTKFYGDSVKNKSAREKKLQPV